MRLATASLSLGVLLLILPATADLSLDMETGIVSNTSNRIRVPGTTGTPISLPDSFNVPAKAFSRFRLNYTPDDDDTYSVLVAPLTFTGTGTVATDVDFNGVTFPADTPLNASYKFNSYRLTYRHTFNPGSSFEYGLGLTAKVRDAAISLGSATQTTTTTNLGFVPLINFRADWHFASCFALELEGDALAAPQGRAEDVMLALSYEVGDSTDIRLGYRIVEGGADVPTVFNFSRIDYGVLGVEHRF